MLEMPYWIVPLVAVVWLAFRHISSGDASVGSKRLVYGLTVGSVVIPRLWPGLSTPAALLQVAICVYLHLYQTVARPADKSGEDDR